MKIKIAKCFCGGDYYIFSHTKTTFKAQCSSCLESGIVNTIKGKINEIKEILKN